MLKDAGVEIVFSEVQMPGMNAVMERRVHACRREWAGRTLIWYQRHLLHALRESGQFYNEHRPHQGIASARPLNALPVPVHGPAAGDRLHIRRRDRLGGLLASTSMPHNLHGQIFGKRTATNARGWAGVRPWDFAV